MSVEFHWNHKSFKIGAENRFARLKDQRACDKILKDCGYRKYGTSVFSWGKIDMLKRLTEKLEEANLSYYVTPNARYVLQELRACIRAQKREFKDRLGRMKAEGNILRPFQRKDALRMAIADSIINAYPPGLGKTVTTLAAIPDRGRILIVCPAVMRETWREETNKWRPEISVEMLDKQDNFYFPDAPNTMLICNYEQLPLTTLEGAKTKKHMRSLDDRLHNLDDEFCTVVFDEFHYCFVADTLITTKTGPKRIEDVRTGDIVLSYNFNSSVLEWKEVAEKFNNRLGNRELVKVITEFGDLICTSDHKIWTDSGYACAKDLAGHAMWLVRGADANLSLQEEILQPELRAEASCTHTSGTCAGDSERKAAWGGAQGKERPCCSGAHAPEQPNEICSSTTSYLRAEKGTTDKESEWKRSRNDRASGLHSKDYEHATRTCCRHTRDTATEVQHTTELQARLSLSQTEAGRRDRWKLTQQPESTRERHEERTSFERIRVDRVEIFQQADQGIDSESSVQDTVYDFEVAGNHNYFANGFLVSNCRNLGAGRTKRARLLAQKVGRAGGRAMGLTGTPIERDPEDMWTLLSNLQLEKDAFGNKDNFVKLNGGYSAPGRFGWETHWSGEPDEAVADLLAPYVISRTKESVWKEMPEKVFSTAYVDIKDAKTRKFLDKFMADHGGEEAIERMDFFLTAQTKDIAMYSEIRAQLAMIKYAAMIEEIAEYERAGEPLVVMSAHRAPVELMGDRKGWLSIHGGLSEKKRDQARKLFQEGKLRGIACTIQAAGVGLTLTRASRMFFVDQCWNPSQNEQAQDRIHRITQLNHTCYYHIYTANHPMEKILDRNLRMKQRFIDTTIGRSRKSILQELNRLDHI